MCQFCHKHGEGKKWYLQAKNYSDDLLSDVRRRKFIQEFLSDVGPMKNGVDRLAKLQRAPALIRGLVSRLVTRKMKRVHFGQVVPIEEIERIFGFVNSIVRTACVCRHATLGQEKRYCYGVSLAPDRGEFGRIAAGLDRSLMKGPDFSNVEVMGKQEAVAALRGCEKEGLCHTVWTFHAPFIGGICNCDRCDCLAMRSTVTYSTPVMFRAEWIASLDAERCVGCRQCMRVCQFGAIVYSAARGKAAIDESRCYGCGVCRSVCKTDAIRLEDRSKSPSVAHLW